MDQRARRLDGPGSTQFYQQRSGPFSHDAFNTPKDVAIDSAHGKLYVLDSGNHRVLRFAYPVSTNQPAAELVFGQPDFISSGVGLPRTLSMDPGE